MGSLIIGDCNYISREEWKMFMEMSKSTEISKPISLKNICNKKLTTRFELIDI